MIYSWEKEMELLKLQMDNITWISSDIRTQIDDKWVFNDITLFNNTEGDSLSILNNSIGLTKSQSGPILADYMWLSE